MKKKFIDDEQAKVLDFYALTMAALNFYRSTGDETGDELIFNVFVRKQHSQNGFNVFNGIDSIIKYIKKLKFSKSDIEYIRSLNKFSEDFLEYLSNFKFKGTIYSLEDGTIFFPNETVLIVRADPVTIYLLEADLLNRINHESLIATQAAEFVSVLGGKSSMEFGSRRAHGCDAAIRGARAALIGGINATSCFGAGKENEVPIVGTMGHALIQQLGEYEAFVAFFKLYPDDASALVDTFNVEDGIKNAIRAAKKVLLPDGRRLQSVRIDSGDLCKLSFLARKLLDEAQFQDCKICVSNGLTVEKIHDLLEKKAPIDSFGIGENLITASSNPVFGAVYKLAAVIDKDANVEPKIKISEDEGKTTDPGIKLVYRIYDKNGKAIKDIIALEGENFYIPEGCTAKSLLTPVCLDGELVYDAPNLRDPIDYHKRERESFDTKYFGDTKTDEYLVERSEGLLKLKAKLIAEHIK